MPFGCFIMNFFNALNASTRVFGVYCTIRRKAARHIKKDIPYSSIPDYLYKGSDWEPVKPLHSTRYGDLNSLCKKPKKV